MFAAKREWGAPCEPATGARLGAVECEHVRATGVEHTRACFATLGRCQKGSTSCSVCAPGCVSRRRRRSARRAPGHEVDRQLHLAAPANFSYVECESGKYGWTPANTSGLAVARALPPCPPSHMCESGVRSLCPRAFGSLAGAERASSHAERAAPRRRRARVRASPTTSSTARMRSRRRFDSSSGDEDGVLGEEADGAGAACAAPRRCATTSLRTSTAAAPHNTRYTLRLKRRGGAPRTPPSTCGGARRQCVRRPGTNRTLPYRRPTVRRLPRGVRCGVCSAGAYRHLDGGCLPCKETALTRCSPRSRRCCSWRARRRGCGGCTRRRRRRRGVASTSVWRARSARRADHLVRAGGLAAAAFAGLRFPVGFVELLNWLPVFGLDLFGARHRLPGGALGLPRRPALLHAVAAALRASARAGRARLGARCAHVALFLSFIVFRRRRRPSSTPSAARAWRWARASNAQPGRADYSVACDGEAHAVPRVRGGDGGGVPHRHPAAVLRAAASGWRARRGTSSWRARRCSR